MGCHIVGLDKPIHQPSSNLLNRLKVSHVSTSNTIIKRYIYIYIYIYIYTYITLFLFFLYYYVLVCYFLFLSWTMGMSENGFIKR